jgi:hypothetical protein
MPASANTASNEAAHKDRLRTLLTKNADPSIALTYDYGIEWLNEHRARNSSRRSSGIER